MGGRVEGDIYEISFRSTGFFNAFCRRPRLRTKDECGRHQWVNQCIDDSKGEPGATPAIARKYCMCMNEKMDDNETKTIMRWEKTH
jgi:hypothetical protein